MSQPLNGRDPDTKPSQMAALRLALGLGLLFTVTLLALLTRPISRRDVDIPQAKPAPSIPDQTNVASAFGTTRAR